MNTLEFLSQPEVIIAQIKLQDGETAYFDGEKYQEGLDPEYGYPYAKADTFIVGKNGPELEASGGDCAVISFYEAGNKVGALLHIDVINIENKAYTDDLIDKMLVALKDIPPETTDVNVFVDIEDNQELPEMAEIARRWHQMIIENLQGHFSQIGSFTRSNGKDVRLNTENGELRVFDNEHRLIFSKVK